MKLPIVEFNKTVLPNGLTVVTEKHPMSHAVCAGIWVCSGTRDEVSEQKGVSHFLEHLVFKGTKKRTAYELSKSMEAVGGDLNAYTSRESTCFHAISLKENTRLNLDVLVDLVSNARFSARDFEREKQVVLQEIAMTNDNPEELIYDEFFELGYLNSGLGWNILGTEKTLKEMTRAQVINYYKAKYVPNNMIVSVAGNVEHNKICDFLASNLGKKRQSKIIPRGKVPKFSKFSKVQGRETEQVHLVVGFPAPGYKSKFRFEAFIANALLGGGMTSRLYQSVREKKGLAYSVYSQLMTFLDTGLITIYAGTDTKNVRLTLELIFKTIENLKRNKALTERELSLFKTQVRGAILLGSDDIENRMTSLGVNEMVFGDYRPVEQVIDDIEKIQLSTVRDFVDKYVSLDKLSILVIGDLSGRDQAWIEQFNK